MTNVYIQGILQILYNHSGWDAPFEVQHGTQQDLNKIKWYILVKFGAKKIIYICLYAENGSQNLSAYLLTLKDGVPYIVLIVVLYKLSFVREFITFEDR